MIAGYSIADLAIIAGAGFAAGALNVAGAPGSLLSFLALSATGMPPLVANATNLAATPMSFVGGVPAAWRARRDYPVGGLGAVGAAIGGTVTGVWLVNRMSTEAFRSMAPALLMIAAIVLVIDPWLRPRVTVIRRRGIHRHRDEGSIARPVLMAGCLFVAGVYAGAWGAGVGVLVLLVLSFTTSWPGPAAHTARILVCQVTSGIGLIAFALTDLVIWPLFFVLAVPMTVGGLLGELLAHRLPGELLRMVVAVMSAFGAGHLI